MAACRELVRSVNNTDDVSWPEPILHNSRRIVNVYDIVKQFLNSNSANSGLDPPRQDLILIGHHRLLELQAQTQKCFGMLHN